MFTLACACSVFWRSLIHALNEVWGCTKITQNLLPVNISLIQKYKNLVLRTRAHDMDAHYLLQVY